MLELRLFYMMLGAAMGGVSFAVAFDELPLWAIFVTMAVLCPIIVGEMLAELRQREREQEAAMDHEEYRQERAEGKRPVHVEHDKWEYRLASIPQGEKSIVDIQQGFNRFGDEGWELAEIIDYFRAAEGVVTVAVFMRWKLED